MRQRWLIVLLLAALGFAISAGRSGAAEPVVEDMSFVQADIRDVFRSLGTAGGYNVLLTSEVRATIDLTFQQRMTIKDAIDLIARSNKYDIRWVNDRTVVIGTTDVLEKNFDVKTSKVFTLYYATVDEIAEALKVVVQANQISKNPRTNQVTIHGSLLELTNAQEIIGQMDHPMPQVSIQARMEEVAENSIEELGLNWDISNLTFGLGSGLAIIPMGSVTAALKALESQNKAVLLAEPNAAVLDSQSANIFIGEKYPVTYVTVDADGNLKYTIQYVEVGTKLTVQARVNLNDIVTTTVQAEVSNISGEVESQGGRMPIIRTRTTKSMVRLRDGQTFVMTGLIQRDQSTQKTGIPILDKMPLLGALFASNRKDDKSTVICVFLTIRVMKVGQDEIPTAGSRSAWENTEETKPAPTAGSGDTTNPPNSGASPGGTLPTGGSAEPATQPGVESGVPSSGPGGSGTATSTGGAPDTQAGDTSLSAEEMAEQANPALAADPVTVPAEPAPGTPETGSTVPTEPTVPVEPATPPATTPPAEPATPAGGADSGSAGTGTTPAITTTPGAPALPRPEDIKYVKYRVKKGDSLAAIGRKFGIPYQEIAAYNGLSTRATLRVGQEIRVPIPDSHKYVVKPRETLWRIAKRYGVTVELLVEINNLADATKIEVGQVIILPCPVNRVVNPGY